MVLHFILDGYNIIKSDDGAFLNRGSLEEQRNRLISFILTERPHGSSKNTVTVVFDSSSSQLAYDSFPSVQHNKDIEVVFSGGRTADERIEELANASPNPAELVVITNDKGIRRRIGGLGAKIMGVSEFIGRRRHPAAGGPPNAEEIDSESAKSIDDEFKKKWGNK